jgi:hypothetical protein
VVDGQENSAGTLVAGSIQEVQKYYTLDKHIVGLVPSSKFSGDLFYPSLIAGLKS